MKESWLGLFLYLVFGFGGVGCSDSDPASDLGQVQETAKDDINEQSSPNEISENDDLAEEDNQENGQDLSENIDDTQDDTADETPGEPPEE